MANCRRRRFGIVLCPGCGCYHVAPLTPVAGDVLIDCPVAGRLPYAAVLPASDPTALLPPPARPPESRPR